MSIYSIQPKLSDDLRGITTANNKIIFVDRALPEEKVSIASYKKHSTWEEARITEIIEKHPQRIQTPCPLAESVLQYPCGGCDLQFLTYQEQLTIKQDFLFKLFAKNIAHENWSQPIFFEQFGYRNRARFSLHFSQKTNQLFAGFREKYSSKVAAHSLCLNVNPLYTNHHQEFIKVLQGVSIRHKIPQFELSVTEKTVAIVIRHLEPFLETDLEKLQEFFFAKNWQLWLQPKGEDSVYALTEYPLLSYQVADCFLEFSIKDFTQINSSVNTKLVDLVLEWLTSATKINDLFSGVGNFSIPLAKAGKTIHSFELSQSMVQKIKSNALLNQVCIESYAFDLLPSVATKELTFAVSDCDAIVLDPPRTGAFVLCQQLALQEHKKIVYVSCNPTTLFRDIEVLCKGGYSVEKACMVDMFPNTKHIECAVLLQKISF